MEPILKIRGLFKRFEPGPWVIDDFDLSIAAGSVVYVLGPSGCGKTTLLRLVCGFESPDAGEIVKEGEVISRPGLVLPPEARRIGMVFQDYALFPHLTVAQNVRFGLEGGRGPLGLFGRRRWGSGEPNGYGRSLNELYDLTGLHGLQERYPHELSGGQQQRVALARALARAPDLILLDEPFSNLDTSLRARIREELRTVLRQSGATSLLVTHDQEEAINLGDRIAVMNEGRLEQAGTPEDILHRPANRLVASFVGLSEFIPGRVDGDLVVTELGSHPLPPGLSAPNGTRLDVQLRPSYVQPCENGQGAAAQVVGLEFQGAQTLYKLALPSGTHIRASLPGHLTLSPGDQVQIRFHPPVMVCFPAT
ncbi:MAG: ABC transporter ATP-binding protein [SAR324 cluster bacterium]|nr:ABC transporter ATP-binding protein [SAR324 cluster bacterium]